MSDSPTMDRRSIWRTMAIGAAGAALAAGALWAADNASGPASAQGPSAGEGGFTLSVGQLRINQRISSAAVRRSNESLGLLDPIRPIEGQPNKVLGWGTANLRDGAVTTPKLGDSSVTGAKLGDGSVNNQKLVDTAVTTEKLRDGAVTMAKLDAAIANRLPMWAFVEKNDNLVRGQGATAASPLPPNDGAYRVTFERDISQCGWTATSHAGARVIGVATVQNQPNQVQVNMYNDAADENSGVNNNFFVQVTC